MIFIIARARFSIPQIPKRKEELESDRAFSLLFILHSEHAFSRSR